MHRNKRQIWNGDRTFHSRTSGLGGTFVVLGNLRFYTGVCCVCGKPKLTEPLTHYTGGRYLLARTLGVVLLSNDIDTQWDSMWWVLCEPDWDMG